MRAAIGFGLVTALLLLLGPTDGPASRLGGVPVSLQAAALIGLCYYLSQSAWLAGLAYWTLYRPLVAGLLVGVILGDPTTGARVGALLNIAYLGFLGTGGALPTDMALIGYVGAAVALAAGLEATASLALSVPFGLVGYVLYGARRRWFNAIARRASVLARRGDMGGLARWNVLVPQSVLLLLALAPAMALAYLAPAAARSVIGASPSWVLAWLDLTGTLLVALGAANGLALVWTHRTAACFLGAVVAGLTAAMAASRPEFVVLAGLLAAAVAMGLPLLTRRRGAGPPPADRAPADAAEGAPSGAAPGGGRIRARDRSSSLLTWLFFSHACYSEERLQGIGLAHAMAPVLRRLYPTRGALASALARYVTPFNVEPNLGSALVGVLGRQEGALADGRLAPTAPEDTRTRLAGPVSGVGDTVIHGAVGTVAIALGVTVAVAMGPVGAIAYCALMAAVVWGVSGWAYRRGYRGGVLGVLDLLRSDAWRRVVVGAECAGAILLGLLTTGPVAGLLAPAAAASAGGESAITRALVTMPAVALVTVFLGLQRWGVRVRWLTVACYGSGLVVALVHLL